VHQLSISHVSIGRFPVEAGLASCCQKHESWLIQNLSMAADALPSANLTHRTAFFLHPVRCQPMLETQRWHKIHTFQLVNYQRRAQDRFMFVWQIVWQTLQLYVVAAVCRCLCVRLPVHAASAVHQLHGNDTCTVRSCLAVSSSPRCWW